jgi:hypothetical protein
MAKPLEYRYTSAQLMALNREENLNYGAGLSNDVSGSTCIAPGNPNDIGHVLPHLGMKIFEVYLHSSSRTESRLQEQS